MATRRNVVIVGGGFAGINAALQLGNQPVDVTLVDRRNHHTFQPLLYQVALAVLSPADIAQPIRSILRRFSNIEVLMDEVTGFDLGTRTVFLKSTVALPYDTLILATGATHSYFGNDHWAPLAPGLKTVEDAIEIRRRVLLAFELAERQKLETGTHPPLNFVVIGGGPTGVELAGAISDIARVYMRHDFRHIDPTQARVILMEGAPRILGAYPEDLSHNALTTLTQLGVEVHLQTQVIDIQPGYVVTRRAAANGETVELKTESVVTLWAAGVQASPLGALLGRPLDRRGCVEVNEYLHPVGHAEIFLCGDLAHVEENGRQIPGVAQPAIQMGTYAGQQILAQIAGRPSQPFHYFDKGDMATIGRQSAVANIVWPFRAHWSGFRAWIAWLLVHIYFLIGFRNRVTVFSQWAWTYLTFTRGARLITGSQVLPGWEELSKPGPK